MCRLRQAEGRVSCYVAQNLCVLQYESGIYMHVQQRRTVRSLSAQARRPAAQTDEVEGRVWLEKYLQGFCKLVRFVWASA